MTSPLPPRDNNPYEKAAKEFSGLISNQQNLQPMSREFTVNGLIVLHYKGDRYLFGMYTPQEGASTRQHLGAVTLLDGVTHTGANKAKLDLRLVRPDKNDRAMELMRKLNPAEVHITYEYLSPDLLNPHISGNQWDTWGIGGRSTDSQTAIADRTERTNNMMSAMIDALKKSGRTTFDNAQILFVGCGDGVEIEAFLEKEHQNLHNASIVAFDQSAPAIEKTRTRIQRSPHSDGCDITLHHMNFADMKALSDSSFTHAFAVGIFDRETLNFQNGTELACNLRMKLTPTGKIVCSSYVVDLFNKGDYEAFGYSALHGCVMSELFNNNGTHINPSVHVLENTIRPVQIAIDTIAAESVRFWQG